jgi:hypothetical protein
VLPLDSTRWCEADIFDGNVLEEQLEIFGASTTSWCAGWQRRDSQNDYYAPPYLWRASQLLKHDAHHQR